MQDSNKSCSTNVMHYCTVDKLVLSNHLYQMHSLLAELLQTLWNIYNLVAIREKEFQRILFRRTALDFLQTDNN